MEFKTRHIGAFGYRASKIIELTVNINGAEITEDVTNLDSKVDENLILELRELADELEEQNEKLNQ